MITLRDRTYTIGLYYLFLYSIVADITEHTNSPMTLELSNIIKLHVLTIDVFYVTFVVLTKLFFIY